MLVLKWHRSSKYYKTIALLSYIGKNYLHYIYLFLNKNLCNCYFYSTKHITYNIKIINNFVYINFILFLNYQIMYLVFKTLYNSVFKIQNSFKFIKQHLIMSKHVMVNLNLFVEKARTTIICSVLISCTVKSNLT